MFYISKRLEVSGSHKLDLPYESKCKNLHGHNWIITIYCKSPELTSYGMIIDFTVIKEIIHSKLDHVDINNTLNFNPTAENICKWICDEVSNHCEVGYCYKVEIQESEGNIAIYERD